MLVRNAKFWALTFFVLDMAIIVGSFFAAFFAKKHFILADPYLDLGPYLNLLGIEFPFIIAIMALSGLYSSRMPFMGLYAQFRLIARSALLVYAVFLIVSFYSKIFSSYPPSRVVFTLFFAFFPAGLAFSRFFIAWLRKHLKQSYFTNRVIIFGGFDTTKNLIQRLSQSPYFHFEILAVAGQSGVPVDDGINMIEQGSVDSVVIDLPFEDHHTISRISSQAEKEGTAVYMTPRAFPANLLRLSPVNIGGIPLIALQPPDLPLSGIIAKRILDLSGSLALIIVLSPLLVLIAAVVKLTSKGPVFYSQERVGIDGKPFTMYKFRTMRVDAEKETGPVWAKEGDERCTRVGSVLRRSNLDELPQLINVLAGSMSLVGPRPERPEFVKRFKEEIGRYSHKHWVKPGITGWAQINGWRGDTDLTERIRHDLYYIENWSIWLDLKILILTPLLGFKNAI